MYAKRVLYIAVCFFSLSFFSCPNVKDQPGEERAQSASITFVNHSSFKVDLYKNFNPNYYDPTTLACSIDAGQNKIVSQYASADQEMGDTFYVRYKVQLANRLDTGTVDIFADARRDMSNISFVIKNGMSYTKTIPQPEKGQLQFTYGYIAVQNTGSSQIRIINGIEQLSKMDDNGAYLYPGQNIGYYQISFPALLESINANHLKATNGQTEVNFPAFIMERGKLYSFAVSGSGVSGPDVSNLNLIGDKDSVTFVNFASPSIRVDNNTGEKLVAFKDWVSPDNLISGIPANAENHGLKKDASLFNTKGEATEQAVTSNALFTEIDSDEQPKKSAKR